MDNEQKISAAEDQEMVRAFLAGSNAAFDQLVLKYKDFVYALCYRFFGDHDEANDCAQETFVKVYRSLGKFKGEASFSTWLYTIALNTCRNRQASFSYRLKKFTTGIDTPKETEDGDMAREITDGAPLPSEELEKQEEERTVQKAIDSLAEKQRELVLLRDIQGLSYEEIAAITGCNPGTVKSKLARARQQLKIKLEVFMQ